MQQLDTSSRPRAQSLGRVVDRWLLALGGMLMTLQGVVVTSLATNLPFSDGWTVLRSHCLENAIQWRWIWELHNEHRLVWTKLLHWLNYRFFNYSLIGQATINYVFYALLVWALLDFLKREFQAPAGLMLVSLSSALVWEIHFWGFQTHFLLYPLCLVLALRKLICDDKQSWWGAFWAAIGVYTMANGVLAAGCCAAFCAMKAYLRPASLKHSMFQALLITSSILPWFYGFHKNPGHPDFAGPWSTAFWWHLGLTFTQGFGLQFQNLAWLGVLLFVALIALWAFRLRAVRREPYDRQLAWLALAAYTAAMLLSVGVTSMARAGLGGPTPRYCFPVVLLVPVFWSLLTYDWLRQKWQFALVGVALLTPLVPHYRYARIYSEANNIIDKHRGCVVAYYRGDGDGDCPGSYPMDLRDILELAREMRLPFTQDMIPSFERYVDAPTNQLAEKYCHLDGLDAFNMAELPPDTTHLVHSRKERLKMMGWAWDAARYYPQRDVAIEFIADTGQVYALSASRFRRRDLKFFRGSSHQQWGLILDTPTPSALPNGLYPLRVRQGHGPTATVCRLDTALLVTD